MDYYRAETNDDANENNAANNKRENNDKTTTKKSSEYKAKIIGKAPAYSNTLDKEVNFPSIYLSSFRRSFDFPLIKCVIELHLSWSRKSIMSEIHRTSEIPANPADNPSTDGIPPIFTSEATFQINSTEAYVPVVNLSINYNSKFLEHMKQGLKGTIVIILSFSVIRLKY